MQLTELILTWTFFFPRSSPMVHLKSLCPIGTFYLRIRHHQWRTAYLRNTPRTSSGLLRNGPTAPSHVVEVSYNKNSDQKRSDSCPRSALLEQSLHGCVFSCVAGKQYTRFGCRRKSDGKMMHRTFCANIPKPRAISRACNVKQCSEPV